MSDREKEIEREWRRCARKDFCENLLYPCLTLLAIAAFYYAVHYYYPVVFDSFAALLAAIGLPVCMWLSKQK